MRKSNKFRQILAAAIVVAVAVLGWTLYLKLPQLRKKAVPASRLPHNIDVSIRTLTYAETRDGVRKWVLEAQQADVAQKDNRIFLTQPRFVVYLQQQPGTVTFTAGQAEYDLASRDVTLTDGVEASSDTGMTVVTDRIVYQAAQSLLTSDDHVKISHRNAVVEGDGLELHTVKGTVKLLRNVHATLQPGGH